MPRESVSEPNKTWPMKRKDSIANPSFSFTLTDPVVKAEMDLARLGKVYGESHHAKGFWKRGTSMMGQFGTMATGGAF